MVESIRVMIVDDSALVCSSVGASLTAAGFEVITRTNPIGTGAAILRDRPAVVLLDVSMPLLDGADILESLRRAPGRRRTRILLHSDRSAHELAELCERAGADGYVQKGERPEVLATRVREAAHRVDRAASARVLVVEPDPALRGELSGALADCVVQLSDSGTEALLAIGSPTPPDVIVASTELEDLPTATLVREALRLDPSFRERFVLVRGPSGTTMREVAGFTPMLIDRRAAVAEVRRAVERAGRQRG